MNAIKLEVVDKVISYMYSNFEANQTVISI